MTLSLEQGTAVKTHAPVVLLVACPGAGKSKVLVERIKRLVRDGVDPAKICAVTFTNAAAKVMQERLATFWDEGKVTRIIDSIRLGHCGTLHSLMLRLLRQHHALVGLPEGVTVMDDDQAAELLEQCRQDLRVKATDKALAVAVKEMRCGLAAYKLKHGENLKKEALVAAEYFGKQRQTGELDFDSVLVYGKKLAMTHPDTFTFDHYLVDEVQDSANIDFDIYVSAAMRPDKTLFMVGDDSQAIYSFRGGNVGNMLRFAATPQTQTLHLSTNYRSVPALVDLGQRLIRHNKERIDHPVKSSQAERRNGLFRSERWDNPAQELAWIANSAVLSNSNDMLAILFRTNFLADQCREHLRGLGVPLAERKTVARDTPEAKLGKAVLAFMANPWSDTAALRLVANMDGAPGKLTKVVEIAGCAMTSKASVVQRMYPKLCYLSLSEWTVAILGNHFVNNDYALGWMWILELAKTVPEPFTIGDLLLVANRTEEAEPAGEGVVVSTVHASKGLEYDTVIIGGFEDDQFPGRDDEEESRRLLYVGMTRARSRLFLSWCATRPDRFLTWETKKKLPSRFLAEITGSRGTP